MSDKRDPGPAGEMRASDGDRQAVVERLRLAMDEGRLNLHEWDERVALAYRASTYAELTQLAADLPPIPAAVSMTKPAKAAKAPDLIPMPLKVLWTIWFTAVLINLVVWSLVSLSNFQLEYFWPIWVAGPAGAALAGVTVGANAIRGSRRKTEARRRAEQGARKVRKAGH